MLAIVCKVAVVYKVNYCEELVFKGLFPYWFGLVGLDWDFEIGACCKV